MIAELGMLVKTLAEALIRFNKKAQEAEKRADNLGLLKIYYLLKDVQEDGCQLLELASPNPIEYVKSASSEALAMRLKIWDAVLRRQSARLHEIQNYLKGRSDLSIIDPKAQKRIAIIVGSKRGRVLNLFGLGAGLFFRTVMPIRESPEALGELVIKTLDLQDSETLDLTKIKLELDELEEALEEYRKLLFAFMSNEDVRTLSDQARGETRM
ncbi:hypothetical protein [Pseudomonas sp. A-R-26]|uniref:hypothetical protein n=1 Tax=Pseudomonas sp. A-R-26 TaxID=2832404 RepID=UPI001CBD40B6|nr:hypothetical protein [Pseudomonas sp. A-R-26]